MGKRKTIREAAAVQISKLIDFKMFFKKTVRVPRGKLDFRRNKSIRQNQLKVQSTFQSSREKWTRKMPQPLAVTAFMASPRRFELPTPRLGGVCSIQLSYEDICSFLGERRERTYLTGLRLSDY